MSLVLSHVWKEWRSQRSTLVGYVLLLFTSLCLGFAMVPEHWWQQEGSRANGLAWFVAAGVLGVIAFVAPALVRREYGVKDDQFVRRLPGALGASFGGKLVFFVLATLALPLMALLWGETFLTASGVGWHDLFVADREGDVHLRWPWCAECIAIVLLAAPWVWAVGTWTPSGRMAVGGTLLFVLVLGLGVAAVLRQCPHIEQGVGWQPWIAWLAPLGFVAAGFAWVKGRRGGGPLRSARFGLVVTGLGLVPPGVWLGAHAWRYHHPDPHALVHSSVVGIEPSGRFALVRGAEHWQWREAHFRVDLATGAAEQIAGTQSSFFAQLHALDQTDQRTRFWQVVGGRSDRALFDLGTGEWTAVPPKDSWDIELPEALRAHVFAERRNALRLHTPDHRRVWFEPDHLCCETADGSVVRRPLLPKTLAVTPGGHGYRSLPTSTLHDFDGTLRVAEREWSREAWFCFVGDLVLYVPTDRPQTWVARNAEGVTRVCEPLRGCQVLGLFDDRRVLCRRGSTVFLFEPATEQAVGVMELRVKPRSVSAIGPLREWGTLLPRDPGGRVWLNVHCGRDHPHMCVDETTLEVTEVPVSSSSVIVGWPDASHVLLQDGKKILRVDTETGARDVLFPRR